MNDVTLVGNVGALPQIRTTLSGQKVAKIRLATSDVYNDKKRTQWHNLVLWNRLADWAEKYVKVGDTLAVKGRIEYREFIDGETKRWFTDIVVNRVNFVGGKKGQTDQSYEMPPPDDVPYTPDDYYDDDVPF